MLRVTIAVSHDSHRGWSLDGHGNGQEVVRLCQALDIWNCYFLSQLIAITLVTSNCFALSSFPYWYPARLHTKLNETANDNEIFLFASIFKSRKLFHKDCINKKEEKARPVAEESGGWIGRLVRLARVRSCQTSGQFCHQCLNSL